MKKPSKPNARAPRADAAPGSPGDVPMPHERDETSAGQVTEQRQSSMVQAHQDVVDGQQDTDLHNIPGVEKTASPRRGS